jgi:hypothetical protein
MIRLPALGLRRLVVREFFISPSFSVARHKTGQQFLHVVSLRFREIRLFVLGEDVEQE